jgi:hypothetical protein
MSGGRAVGVTRAPCHHRRFEEETSENEVAEEEEEGKVEEEEGEEDVFADSTLPDVDGHPAVKVGSLRWGNSGLRGQVQGQVSSPALGTGSLFFVSCSVSILDFRGWALNGPRPLGWMCSE